MLKKGDRVYHKSINGNGLIVAIDESKHRDKYGVVFNWLRRKTVDFHNLGGLYPRHQCRWCSEDQLVKSEMPIGFRDGRVSMVGNRSLERLIRRITRIKRTRDVYDKTEIVINYGAGTAYTPPMALVLNGNAPDTYDKFVQYERMRDAGVPVPESITDFDKPTDGSWILKPHFGFGGKGIEEFVGQRPDDRFLQKRVNKVREFRVHVAMWYGDPAWLIQEKKIDNRSQLCWNKHQGGSFHYVHEPYLDQTPLLDEDPDLTFQLMFTAIQAVEALGLDFGGVDLALCDDGKVWVFEVNTRCGMLERTLAGFKRIVWSLQNLNIERYLEMLEHRRESIYDADEEDEEFFDEDEVVKLSDLEDVVSDEERMAMLEAGRSVELTYEQEDEVHIEEESKPIRRSFNMADSEVSYAYR